MSVREPEDDIARNREHKRITRKKWGKQEHYDVEGWEEDVEDDEEEEDEDELQTSMSMAWHLVPTVLM